MSKQEIDKWRKCDPDFSAIYDNLLYGDRGTFICLYKTVFDNWYGEGIPYNTARKQNFTITSRMPAKIKIKYSLHTGDTFVGLAMLNKHCQTTVSLYYWKTHGWIVSYVE